MQLIKEQIEQFEAFISKLPISKVRSDIERLWETVKSKGYIIRSELLDKLKEFSIHIEDVTLQSFIQSFEHWVKNEDGSQSPKEAPKKEIEKANLGQGVANSIKKAKVIDKDTSDSSVAPVKEEEVAPKKIENKKEESKKKLDKDAKEGDMHRTVSGMKDHDSKSVKTKVIIEKPVHKNKKK